MVHVSRLLATMILVFVASEAARAEAADVAPLRELFALHGPLSEFDLPALTEADFTALAGGDPVIRVSAVTSAADRDETESMGVYGVKVVDAPRLLVWLALLGGVSDGSVDKRYTSATLARMTAGAYARYQHIDLPWPFRDRHWVIHASKNPGLAERSSDRIWEHSWTLHERGAEMMWAAHDAGDIVRLSRKKLDKSVYLPANRGAWTVLELDDDRTLIGAYFNADLGGSFPAGLVRSFTKRQLKSGLRSIAAMSAQVHLFYDAEPAIHDGHGQPISAQQAAETARLWLDSSRLASVAD